MKKFAVSVAGFAFALAVAFGLAVAVSPATAVAHPGNTCNPPAGHGRSGCHRVTVAPAPARTVHRTVTAPRPMVRRSAPKPAPRRVTPPPAAPAQPAFPATPATQPAPPAPAATVVAPPATLPAAPAPWWVSLWRVVVSWFQGRTAA